MTHYNSSPPFALEDATKEAELLRHQHFMALALEEAEKAYALGEVPIGALLVQNGTIIGRGYNRSIIDHDPTAHAEMNAIRSAAKHIQNYRLTGSDLYVTLEPCMMCAGSLIHARIDRVIFGAGDSRNGGLVSQIALNEIEAFNHKVSIIPHILEEKCRTRLKQFFKERRAQQKHRKGHTALLKTEEVTT